MNEQNIQRMVISGNEMLNIATALANLATQSTPILCIYCGNTTFHTLKDGRLLCPCGVHGGNGGHDTNQ